MTFLAHIADRALNTPLLITPDKATVIVGVLSGRIGVASPEANRFEGDNPPQRDEQGNIKRDMFGYAKMEPFKMSGSTAIVTVTGSLVNRGAWIGAYSGLTSYEGLQHQLKRAAENPETKAIVLDLHSPGGEAVGAFETADLVREIGKTTPVTAIVNGLAASAAYAIASGANEIVTTPSGVSGSIGVVWLHADYSRYLENEGVKPTFIFAGEHKVDGHPFGPLPDAVRADIQAQIDAVYDQFLSTVAAGRGTRLTADMARATGARVFTGQAAVAAGLADKIGTFESVLADLSRAAGRSTSSTKGKTMSEPNAPAAAPPAAPATTVAAPAAPVLTQASIDAAVATDRTRMAGLDELAAKCAGNADALKVVADAKTSGATVEATALALVKADAFTKAAVLGAIQQDDRTAAGATTAAPGAGAAQVPQTPEGWKAEFEGSAELQKEFTSSAAYVAFKKAEARGGVKVLGRK